MLISVAITVLITAILAALGILKSPKSIDDLVGTQNRDIQNVKKTTTEPKIEEQSASESEHEEIQRQKELAIQSMQKKMDESENIEDSELKSQEEVIELEEETTPKEPELEDNTVQGRFAALRNEINSDDEVQNKESIEDRMKKFFGSDYITTTPFYTLDAVDDELLAEILRCDLNEDWTSVLSEERVKERLESQGVICKSREDISWDNATILFTFLSV